MTRPGTLHLYLDAETLARIAAGTHNFFNRLLGAVTAAGWRVDLRTSSAGERLRAPGRRGHALFLMEEPTHDRALTCRRTYVGAFWHIEATARRWDWPVAKTAFPADQVDAKAASTFVNQWRNRLYPGANPISPRQGFVFVPLQGRLLDHRSFQSMSPLAMLQEVLGRSARPVLATLHPSESYTTAETDALARLADRFPRLTVQAGGSDRALQDCDLVVTQNSAMAFRGYFFRKPAILFAKIDFHHIAASVPHLGLTEAFYRAERSAPDFDGYLYWFLKGQSINAGHADCEDQIRTSLRRNGWPI